MLSKKEKYVEIQYNTDNTQILCITIIFYSTVTKHETHIQSNRSGKKKIELFIVNL